MRIPADLPRRRPGGGSRRRTVLIAAVVAVVVLLVLSRALASFYTDALWFQDLGFSKVFYGVLGAKVVLAVAFIALAFLLLYGNLLIADRLAPQGARRGPEDELVQRYRDVVGHHAGKVRFAVAALLSILLGAGASGRWETYLLWRHRTRFGGAPDPQFHRDAGFYVFDLPWRSFLVSWVIVALITTVVITSILHYLNGGIRLQVVQHRGATPQVKAHLSVLVALVALCKAYAYWLERFSLVYSNRGFAQGAFYTDVKAKLPALTLLTLISVAAAVLLLANIYRRGVALPAISIGLWIFVTILVGSAYPAFIQQVRVKPNASRLELPYLARNIAGTRRAFGLDSVEVKGFDYTEAPGAVTGQDLVGDAATIRNIRLWDPNQQIATQTWQQQQSLRSQFQVQDVDVDRYPIDGRATQVIIATRELKPSGIPQDNWVNRHLQYTHGYGAIIAPANAATSDGLPSYSLSDLPPHPEMTQPRVYVGEQGDQAGPGDYAIVGTKQREVDFQQTGAPAETTSYDGKHGVQLSSGLRRLAFALRFQEPNILLSGFLTPSSRVMYVRGISERVRKAAPFLTFDSDPYPVVLDGRILWVADGYTTTDRFPYSQSVSFDGGLSGVNYARNSVKAVVDAYDGSVSFYAVDAADPLLKAYSKTFPGLFKPTSAIPAGLAEHFRYPEDLFRLQSQLYGAYHIEDATEFFRATDKWSLSPDPGVSVRDKNTATSDTSATIAPANGQAGQVQVKRLSNGKDGRIPAAYQLIKLPGDAKESFSLTVPYVPYDRNLQDQRPQLTAFLAVKSDPGDYGKLVLYRMPSGQQINGPMLIDSNILANPTISQQISLLDQGGSKVLFGNILLVPVDRSIIYVRPLYVQAAGANALPTLEKVIVVYGSKPVIADTLQQALNQQFGSAPPTLEQGTGGGTPATTPSTPGGSGGTASPDVAALIRQADQAYGDAQAALRNGDLATYQKKVDEASAAVKQAAQASGSTPPTTAAPTTPTTASG